jgi:septum formation protein
VPFILASASPRRRKLIKSFSFATHVLPSRAPERRPHADESPRDYALELAELKAKETARRVKEGLVLGADTVVHLGGTILGKPTDAADALKMLSMLTGCWHDVHTALCLIDVSTGMVWRATALTRVRMRKFTEKRLEVLSRRNHDKAGAYAAQAKGNPFVTGYRGDFDNIVGLPRRTLRELLRKAALAGIRPASSH